RICRDEEPVSVRAIDDAVWEVMTTARRPANDCRISCNAASHNDGDRGALCAPTREWPRRKRAAVERGLLEPAARPAGQQAPRCQLLAAVRRRVETERFLRL